MKRVVSFLMAICLLIMPVVMAEDIELNNLVSVDGDIEDTELDIENLEDGIPDELDEIDLSDTLLIDNIISDEEFESTEILSNGEGTTVGPDSDPESIRYVQEMLIAVHALPEGSVNGVYDVATRDAVEDFQRWVNMQRNEYTLEITGLVDDLTRLYLEYCVDHSIVIREDVAISSTNFPDDNFRKYVLSECDSNHDGFLSVSEIEETDGIGVQKYGIVSLQGIEFFTELEWLDCRSNRLTELDLSSNPKLNYLWCYDNDIREMDISNNQLLVENIQKSGAVRSGNMICFYPVTAYDEPEPYMILDNELDIYANGNKIYGSDLTIVRNTGTITIGVGEKIWGINTEEDKWRPYWIHLLSGSEYTCSVKSSNLKVAKGVNSGYVKGLKVGTAKITATATDTWGPGTGTTYTLKVKKAPSKVTLSKTKLTLNIYDEAKIIARLPSGSACRGYKWISSNDDVVSVDEGEVYAHNPGSAIITVKTYNGKKATCKVTVIDPSVPIKVKLNKSGTVKLKKGKSLRLKATVTPSTAQTTLTWKSSNKKVATVTQYGLVKAKKKGTATITVKTENGKTAKVKIKVV